jgi:hypothetical protein
MTNENNGIPPAEPTPQAPRPDPYAAPGYSFGQGQGQQGLGQGYGPGAPYAPVAPRRAPVLSILSLIAGIIGALGLWVGFIPFVGFFLGIWFPGAALVLGLFGRKKETQSKGLWLTGIILGSIGLAVAALSLIFWIIIGVSGGFSDNGTNYNFNYDPNSLNS